MDFSNISAIAIASAVDAGLDYGADMGAACTFLSKFATAFDISDKRAADALVILIDRIQVRINDKVAAERDAWAASVAG